MNKKIVINKNFKKEEKERKPGVWIQMPENSKYKGYDFYHLKKYTKFTSNNIILEYWDTFEFNLYKRAKYDHSFGSNVEKINLTSKEFVEEINSL